MKKLICTVLVLILAVAMVACVGQVKETVETKIADENQATYREAVDAHKDGDYAKAFGRNQRIV